MNYHAICFVDMPFGQKSDLKSGVLVDFDQIYNEAIKPAIEQCGLEPLRGDEERTGGIIHSAMFARLLLSEFVLAAVTLANANVFYELGIPCGETVPSSRRQWLNAFAGLRTRIFFAIAR
jgi:hypothetical protein